MPARSWKNWTLFITGLLTLLLPYSGFPQSIKSALLIIFGLMVCAIAGSFLWPYHEGRRVTRAPVARRSVRKERVNVEPLSSVMPTDSRAEEVLHESR